MPAVISALPHEPRSTESTRPMTNSDIVLLRHNFADTTHQLPSRPVPIELRRQKGEHVGRPPQSPARSCRTVLTHGARIENVTDTRRTSGFLQIPHGNASSDGSGVADTNRTREIPGSRWLDYTHHAGTVEDALSVAFATDTARVRKHRDTTKSSGQWG